MIKAYRHHGVFRRVHVQRNLWNPPLDPLLDHPLDLALSGVGFGADAKGVGQGRRDGMHQSIPVVLKWLDPA